MDHNRIDKGNKESEGITFFIRIQYRQNASWQGTIHWLDEKKSVSFRSALEMGTLMQEALTRSRGQENVSDLIGWDDKEEVS